MMFFEKLNNLLGAYDNQLCGTRDGAFLYGICNPTPPLATHIVYPPMPSSVMQGLIDSYRLTIPTELLALYRAMNGAQLFWTVCFVGKNSTRIPYNCFSIHGVPLAWDRKSIQPFNISIEDLNRPKGTPDCWLKFGSYSAPENITIRYDLFVDTQTSAVFATEHNNEECCIVGSWDSIDSCLCFVLDLLMEQDS